MMLLFTLLILTTLTTSTTQTCLPQYDYMVNLYHKSQESSESGGQSKTKIHSFASTGLYWTVSSLDFNFRVGRKEVMMVQQAKLFLISQLTLGSLASQYDKLHVTLYIVKRDSTFKVYNDTYDLSSYNDDIIVNMSPYFRKTYLNLPRFRLLYTLEDRNGTALSQQLIRDECNKPFMLITANRRGEQAFVKNLFERKKRQAPQWAESKVVYKDVTSLEVPSFKCQKRRFELQLKDIGWDSWVIAPVTVDIGVCRGRCDDVSELIPHAVAKHILNSMMPGRQIGDICCQETSYKEIVALYLVDGQLVMSNLPQFVVNECKCR